MTVTDQNCIHKGTESILNWGNGCDNLVQIYMPALYVKTLRLKYKNVLFCVGVRFTSQSTGRTKIGGSVREWCKGEYLQLKRRK
jgi:hypothetical protein